MRVGVGFIAALFVVRTPLGVAWAQRRPPPRVRPTGPAAQPLPHNAPTVVSPQQEWLDRGLALRGQGRFREALAAFETACQPEPLAPCLWYQIEAHDHLHQHLRAAELFPQYDRIRQNVRPEDLVIRARVMGSVAQLRVVPEGPVPTGVTFRLDGVALRSSRVGGEIVFVLPGVHVIEVLGDGRESVQRTVRLTADEGVHAVSLPIPAERVSITRRWWFWTVIGVAVAGGVAAAVVAATSSRSPYDNEIVTVDHR